MIPLVVLDRIGAADVDVSPEQDRLVVAVIPGQDRYRPVMPAKRSGALHGDGGNALYRRYWTA